jgi:Icc-related predicted phosphoesterase
MRLVLISDTHNWHRTMARPPEGDVLIHAGDLTDQGTLEEIAAFFEWFGALPHRHKIVIAGNHDFAFEKTPAEAEALVPSGVTYLRDSGVEIQGFKLWGSPWQPWYYDWAFNLPRGEEIARKWALIPEETAVLVTHGPPHGVLDQAVEGPPGRPGCEALAARVALLPRLRLHVFGHIHEGYGQVMKGDCTFVNACTCDIDYRPRNPAVVVDIVP